MHFIAKEHQQDFLDCLGNVAIDENGTVAFLSFGKSLLLNMWKLESKTKFNLSCILCVHIIQLYSRCKRVVIWSGCHTKCSFYVNTEVH